MNKRDEVRLRDMLDTAQHGVQFIQGKSRQDLTSDVMLAYALMRAVEVVGEAANQLNAELRSAHPQIAWRQIIGMRNILIHNYAEIDLDILWDAAERELPILIEQIKQILEDNGLPPNP